MKRNYLLIVLSLLLVQTGFAQDKLSDLLDKLDGKDKVTQVTITKAMLNMMPAMMGSSVDMNGVDVKSSINKIDQIDIYTSKDADTKKMMIKETMDYFKGDDGKNYDILMKAKDEKNHVAFYGKKDGDFYTSLVMVIINEENCSLIRMLGKFTPQDVQNMTKQEPEK